jgi:hypothetical protein
MTVGQALRQALSDFYGHSWRLLILNTLLSGVVLAILVTALFAPVALVLVVAVGPLAASLMHCAVTLAQTDELELADAARGLRLHWLRGLVLVVLVGGAIALTWLAIRFWAGTGTLAWPLAMLTLYVGLLFGIYQLSLWPLAVYERDRSLRQVLADAALALLRRPGPYVGLGVALFLVNVAGFIAAVIPLLTLTVAYSFLAAAHFALPRNPMREA